MMARSPSVGPRAMALGEFADALWPVDRPSPQRTVRCRACGRQNRVLVSAAVTAPERHTCGACGQRLFIDKDRPLEGLVPEAYQHTLDRRSLAALRSVPGAPELVRWALEALGDRSARMLFMSDAIRCDRDQFPELVDLMDAARLRLDLQVRPAVFLGESPHMNALTTGVSEPLIVVRSALVDRMNDDELIAVFGHELGHLHSEHPLYNSVAQMLIQGGASASYAFRLISRPVQRVLLRWARCAELTADRAALLASRDLRACISMLLMFAGGSRPGTDERDRIRLAPFMRQCREVARLHAGRSVDSLLGGYLTMDRTHPHVAWRVVQLVEWVEHGSYLNILGGDYLRRRHDRPSLPPSGDEPGRGKG